MSAPVLIRHRLDIELDTPAVVGDGLLRGQTRSSRSWIPGQTLLGALAARDLRDHDSTTELPTGFEQTYRRGRFGPALATTGWWEALSYAICKYRPQTGCRTPISDLAFLADSVRSVVCPQCGGPAEEGKGRMRGVDSSVRMHIEMTELEQAKDQQLFRRASLPEGTRLRAAAWLPTAITRTSRVRIGGAASVQGAATLQITPQDSPPVEPETMAHLETAGRIVVQLTAPAALVDEWGRPATTPEGWAWELERAFPGLGATVTRHWVRWNEQGGWQSGGLPKPLERTAVAGSVFVVEFDRQPTSDAVQRFRDAGIGLRTGHGFGWFQLAHQATHSMPDEVASPQETATDENRLSDLALTDPSLAPHIIDCLRLMESHQDAVLSLRILLGRRSWFRRLPIARQNQLVDSLGAVSDPTRTRKQLTALIRTTDGSRS